MKRADVLILGGGMAGLTAALQLLQERPGLRITVLERNRFPVDETAFKVGESTVEVAAHYLGHTLGLETHLREAHLPKLGMRFFFPGGDDLSGRVELGCRAFPAASTWQLARGRLENHLAERCAAAGITLLDGVSIQDVQVGPGDEPHRTTFEYMGLSSTIEARWLVDASGRAAFLKRRLDLGRSSEHPLAAAFLRVARDIRVDDWSDAPAWRAEHQDGPERRLSVNHLMGRGYWVWLIPLATGATSVGLVADPRIHPPESFDTLEKLRAFLELHEPQCARVLFAEDDVLDFNAAKGFSSDCSRVFSKDRWFITGVSGAFVDPFYSPGADFIAYGNTFLTHLIGLDVDADPEVDVAIERCNDFFLAMTEAYFDIFRDHYAGFGNAAVMPYKVAWDWSSYWTYNARMFCDGRLVELPFRADLQGPVRELASLNRGVQELFRHWTRLPVHPGQTEGVYLDWLKCDHLRELNIRLTQGPASSPAVDLQGGVDRMRGLAGELVNTALMAAPELRHHLADLPRSGAGATPLLGFLRPVSVR